MFVRMSERREGGTKDRRYGTRETGLYVCIFSPPTVSATAKLRRKRRPSDSVMKDRSSKKAAWRKGSLMFEYTHEILKKCISRLVGYETHHFDHGLKTTIAY